MMTCGSLNASLIRFMPVGVGFGSVVVANSTLTMGEELIRFNLEL